MEHDMNYTLSDENHGTKGKGAYLEIIFSLSSWQQNLRRHAIYIGT